MSSLNNDVQEYNHQLCKGQIQKAYRGIMSFMSELKAYLEQKYSDHAVSSLYAGYMDMTYFAFTPFDLKNRKLKIAIVFLHEECKFELWLAANNRKTQLDYIQMLSQLHIGKYMLSKPKPGVDSIIETELVKQPDFDHPEDMKNNIELKAIEFGKEILSLLSI
jgi:hypothetical protein